MAQVLILTQVHVSTSPGLLKIAVALLAARFDIQVFNALYEWGLVYLYGPLQFHKVRQTLQSWTDPCTYFEFHNELVHQWKEIMQLFGLWLLQQVLQNDRHKRQDLFLQTDHHSVEVLPDSRLYQLSVGGDIHGLQEDLQQVGKGLHTATGLHGLLTRKSFAHSAENMETTYQLNDLFGCIYRFTECTNYQQYFLLPCFW